MLRVWTGCNFQGVCAARMDLRLDRLRPVMTLFRRMFVCSSATTPSSLPHRAIRKACRSKFRACLRTVLRFTPKSSAAPIWLPRRVATAGPISGSSISCKMR